MINEEEVFWLRDRVDSCTMTGRLWRPASFTTERLMVYKLSGLREDTVCSVSVSSPSNASDLSGPPPVILTLNDVIEAKPVKCGFVHERVRLSVVLSITSRSLTGSEGTGRKTVCLLPTHLWKRFQLTLYSDEGGGSVRANFIAGTTGIGPATICL